VAPDQTSSRWTLIDYADVVVHLFDDDARSFYNLEGLWGDAETINWTPATATV
jgi:ribosome-associated protein